MMRRILVDHARRRRAAKRGGGACSASPSRTSTPACEPPTVDLLALDDALERWRRSTPTQARIVELRFFGGLTVEETAEVLGVSPAHGGARLAHGAGLAAAASCRRTARSERRGEPLGTAP